MNTDNIKKIRYVYFLQVVDDDGFIKIGQSKEPLKRIKEIRYAHDKKVITLLIIKKRAVCGLTESKLHKKFKEYRIFGEWFTPHPKILNFISKIRKGNLAEDENSIYKDTGNILMENGK